jgi:hypothetical protein
MKTIGNIFKKKFIKNQKGTGSYFRRKPTGGSETSEVFDFLDLTNKWGEVIGKTLEKVTIPLKIQQKTLYILTAHPAFSQQLSLMESEIINKIVKKFPLLNRKITKILFKTNPSYFRDDPKREKKELSPEEYTKKNKLNKFSPKYRILKTEAVNLFGHIEDLELQESLTSIYIQNKINQE